MTTTTAKPQSPRLVDPAAARRILEMACRKGVGLALRPTDSTPRTQVAGSFARIGADGETLIIAMDAPLDSVSPGGKVEISFRIATQGFAFQVAYVGADPQDERGGVVLGYPTAVEAVDRRCAPRRRLRARSIVAVRALHAASSCVVRGSLLNLSASGLALHLAAPPPQTLSVGASIQVTLEGGANNEPVSLPARIVSTTEGGDHRSWVVGIEFLQNDMSPEVGDRLAQWLKSPKQE